MRDDDDIWFDSLAGGRGDEPEKAAAAARAIRTAILARIAAEDSPEVGRAGASTETHVDFTNQEQVLRERYAAALVAAGAPGEEFARLSRLLETARAPATVERSLQAVGLSSELRRAGPDSAFAVFLLTANHLRVLLATAKQQIEYQVPVNAADLQKEIGDFLEALNQRADVAAQSRALYRTLAKPLDDAAQAARASGTGIRRAAGDGR